MKKIAYYLVSFIAVLGLIGVGCERTKTLTPGSGPSPTGEKATETIYPHSSDWLTKHGSQYFQGAVNCVTCHGAKLDGGSTGVACAQCHAAYPHPAAWARPDNHGAAFSKLLDQMHGTEGADVQKNDCVLCHKAAANGEDVNPKSAKKILCNTCHVGVPHTFDDMVAKDGQHVHHSTFGHEKALQASCLSCHREKEDGNRTYMPTMGKCTVCHYQPNVTPRVKWMSEDEATKVDDFLNKLRNPPSTR